MPARGSVHGISAQWPSRHSRSEPQVAVVQGGGQRPSLQTVPGAHWGSAWQAALGDAGPAPGAAEGAGEPGGGDGCGGPGGAAGALGR